MLSTVLIIDKRVELSTKYKKCLENFDTNISIARNLKDALIFLQNLEPDMIIVSDSIEEDLSGFCQKIRALTYNSRPIIIALSKSADIDDRIMILENGADDFLSEPVNIDEFKSRIKAHLRRDIELNLDTKTLLPNQKYARKALKRALNSDNQAVLLIGIDNFEEYKSIYTELAGDKLIQTVVAIAKSTLAEEDFIAQYDESDIIVIINKYSAEKFAEFITFAFDAVAPKFYSEEDATRGYMLRKGERYAGMRINFVSLQLGGVLDGFNLIPSVDVLMEKLMSLKKMAKIPTGSNYIFERAKLTASDSVIEDFVNKKIYIRECDESLSYLLRTSLELQGYDIQEQLDEASSIQPSIIILDSENDLAGLKFLQETKQKTNFVNTKFIVTTNVHDKSTILNAGADLYLPKPYEISDLICWVEYFLKRR